jgi:hypothetical protein
MKNVIFPSLIAALLGMLVACGGGGDSAGGSDPKKTPPDPQLGESDPKKTPPDPQVNGGPDNPDTSDKKPPPGVNVPITLVDISPKNKVMPDLEFNTYAGSDNKSDTSGTLPGAVLFAQSQVIPATVRMTDDIQPNMTSLRDALVLFKPFASANLVSGKGILLKAYKADGTLLDTVTMEHPNDIPKTPRFLTNADLAFVESAFNPSNPKEISSLADLNKLNEQTGAYLKELLKTNDSIIIKLADERWVSDIYLPSGSYQGKRIQVISTAGYASTVRYIGDESTGNTKGISVNTSTVFTAVPGDRWATAGDLHHSRYVYGKNFWTAKLPKEWILPGLKLEFVQGNKKGSLNFAAQGLPGLKIGAPTELLMHTIDIGMLTAPRDKFDFAKDDSLHADYFQTLPVSRLVVGKYEALQLDQVVMPDGRVFTPSNLDPSPDVGVYSGAMRESISKLLILHGIDNANYGISSSSSTSEKWDEGGHPFWAAQIAANHAIGKYAKITSKADYGKDGLWVHGLSGGAGMASLKYLAGNEFSHEVGHNFGLDHYGGSRQSKASIFRPSNDVNSAWGWDSRSNIFIPNFVQNPTTKTRSTAFERTCYWTGKGEVLSDCVAPFQINDSLAFSFGRDTMSDADPNHPPHWRQVNRYSMYSPDSAFRTQAFLESKVVFDKTSSTGFRKWNPSTLNMEEIELRAPNYSSIHADVSSQRVANVTPYTSYLESLFTDGADLVIVKMGDGEWGSAATAPSAENKTGKWLTINHIASSGTTWTINGQTVAFKTGKKETYQSDGTQWVPVATPDVTVARKPELFGTSVTTILGYYDPQNARPTTAQPGWPGYIYPALHGAYGFVYPSESSTRPSTGCWLEVNTSNPSAMRRYKLQSVRLTAGYMNKFHVNVPAIEGARSAEVFCGGTGLTRGDLAPATNPLTYTVNGMPLSAN